MNTELATMEAQVSHAVNPLDIAPQEFRGAIQRRGENRKSLVEWVRSALVENVDFGCIPMKGGRKSKPSLWKPGAEKICGMLNVTATFPTLSEYEKAALEGRELREVVVRCHLVSSYGQVVADGIGARSLDKDYGDLNKALKMALKSAHIDATLRMAGLSEVFTQDIEDMPKEQLEKGDSAATAGYALQPPAKAAPPQQSIQTERRATDRQVKLLQVKLDQAGITEKEFMEKFGLADIAELPFSKVNPALHWISGVSA